MTTHVISAIWLVLFKFCIRFADKGLAIHSTQICSTARKSAAPIRLQYSNGPTTPTSNITTCEYSLIAMDVETVTRIASEAGRRLGYQSMKPEQVDVVCKILQGREVFAIMPTGFGRSLRYTCLPSAFDILLKQESGHSLVIVVQTFASCLTPQ